MTKVYLSLGSNMGNRQDYLKKAVESLDRLLETEVKAVSSYYETGKFLLEMKLLKMVNGFQDLVMTSSKWLKKSWVILRLLPKTLVILMIRHVNFLQTVVTQE